MGWFKHYLCLLCCKVHEGIKKFIESRKESLKYYLPLANAYHERSMKAYPGMITKMEGWLLNAVNMIPGVSVEVIQEHAESVGALLSESITTPIETEQVSAILSAAAPLAQIAI